MKKVNAFINRYTNQIFLTLVGISLAWSFTLNAETASLKSTVSGTSKRMEMLELQEVSKDAFDMLRDDVRETNTLLKEFMQENRNDHDSLKAKLSRMKR